MAENPIVKAQGDGKAPLASSPPERSSAEHMWRLEEAFPDVGALLAPVSRASAADADVLVVLDTNVLLLPFHVGTQDLPKIEDVYRKLISFGRLFVPARVIREFIKNRDGRLAEIAKRLRDQGSESSTVSAAIPPLLGALSEASPLKAAADKLNEARKEYLNAIDALVARIQSWRGDDPVTSMYQKLFDSAVVIDVDEGREQIENDWRERLQKKIPPGYKDGSKPDTGIGDFAIWLVLLKLARLHNKSLIFVTGEEKADWFVRCDGSGVYPRPELVDEFRRASNGKHLHLRRLADVLADMNAPADVVHEVREAETAANVTVQLAGASIRTLGGKLTINTSDEPLATSHVTFDYSKNDGEIVVGNDSNRFRLRFGKAGDKSIHLYRSSGTPYVARAKNAVAGEVISFDTFDSSSRAYTIQTGELFLAKDTSGRVLAGRIDRIADDRRGAPYDELVFFYRIFASGEPIVAP